MDAEQKKLYDDFFAFINRADTDQLNDSPFERYFSKNFNIEQDKIIADRIISLVEDAGICELSLYSELNKRMGNIRTTIQEKEYPFDYPQSRLNAMWECIEKCESALAEIMRGDQEPASIYRPGTVSIIGGRHKTGKTTFALQLINEMHISTAYFFVDSYSEELYQRRLPPKYPDYIAIDRDSGLTSASLCEKVRQLKESHNIQLVVIDNLQKVCYNDSRNMELLAQTLKYIASEFQVAVVALSLLARGKDYPKGNPHPSVNDIPGWEELSPYVDNVRLLGYSMLHTDKEIQDKFESIMVCKPFFIWQEIPPVKIWYEPQDHSFHTSVGISVDFKEYEIDCLDFRMYNEYGIGNCIGALYDKIVSVFKEKGVDLHSLYPD